MEKLIAYCGNNCAECEAYHLRISKTFERFQSLALSIYK